MKKPRGLIITPFLLAFLSVAAAQETPDEKKADSDSDQRDILARQSTVFERPSKTY